MVGFLHRMFVAPNASGPVGEVVAQQRLVALYGAPVDELHDSAGAGSAFLPA